MADDILKSVPVKSTEGVWHNAIPVHLKQGEGAAIYGPDGRLVMYVEGVELEQDSNRDWYPIVVSAGATITPVDLGVESRASAYELYMPPSNAKPKRTAWGDWINQIRQAVKR